MTTERLYYADAYLRRFEAEVTAITQLDARPAVVLDRSAFYPEAGGQLGDHGDIGGRRVVDTQEGEAGEIMHVLDTALEGDPLPIGTRINAELDWSRRRQHMAQHTAQHLLSAALLDRARAETVSSRLGESALTIDVRRDRIPDAELAAAEDLANDVIDDDVTVRAWFPEPGELASLALRRSPKVTENVRVVAIGDFDLSPCGGTHCARTSQLGALRIVSAERYKGLTRVTFAAARRGRLELFARDAVLRSLAGQLSCGPSDIAAAVDRLRRDLADGNSELARLRSQLAQQLAQQLPGSGPAIVQLDGDAELLRGVAAKLVASGRDALLCATLADGSVVVLMRAQGSSLDCAKLWKKLSQAFGGRGGGRADRAEGKLSSPIADWTGAVSAALSGD